MQRRIRLAELDNLAADAASLKRKRSAAVDNADGLGAKQARPHIWQLDAGTLSALVRRREQHLQHIRAAFLGTWRPSTVDDTVTATAAEPAASTDPPTAASTGAPAAGREGPSTAARSSSAGAAGAIKADLGGDDGLYDDADEGVTGVDMMEADAAHAALEAVAVAHTAMEGAAAPDTGGSLGAIEDGVDSDWGRADGSSSGGGGGSGGAGGASSYFDVELAPSPMHAPKPSEQQPLATTPMSGAAAATTVGLPMPEDAYGTSELGAPESLWARVE